MNTPHPSEAAPHRPQELPAQDNIRNRTRCGGRGATRAAADTAVRPPLTALEGDIQSRSGRPSKSLSSRPFAPASRSLSEGWSFAVGLLLLIQAAFAQGSTDPARKAQLEAHRSAFATAQASAVAGNLAQAEEALSTLSSARSGTANWHFDTAQRLAQLADRLARSGRAVPANAAARRALDYLLQADRSASDPNLRAAIRQQTGFIYERFLGDVESAKASYRSAMQLAPANASAREKLEFLEKADANSRRKLGQPGT